MNYEKNASGMTYREITDITLTCNNLTLEVPVATLEISTLLLLRLRDLEGYHHDTDASKVEHPPYHFYFLVSWNAFSLDFASIARSCVTVPTVSLSMPIGGDELAFI